MKKLMSILCSLVLVMSCGAAFAAYDEEIRFQDIPWESTIEETAQLLKDCGLYTGDVAELINARVNSNGYYLEKDDNWLMKGYAYPNERNGVGSITVYKDNLGKIAGYDLGSLTLTFALNDEKSALVSAVVTFSVDDKAAVWKDLQKKLAKVYGEGIGVHIITDLELDFWNGANNTALCLQKMGKTASSLSFELIYATRDAEKLMKKFYKSDVSDVDDLGGL